MVSQVISNNDSIHFQGDYIGGYPLLSMMINEVLILMEVSIA